MKTHPSIEYKKNRRRRGGALLLAVLFFAFTAVFLATYLYLCRNEYTSVARSQTWNTSMVMAEAGMEDALAFVNQNANGAVGTLGNWPSTAAANGWSVVSNTSGNVYSVSGRSPNASLGYYTVYITNNASTTNGPTILSIGTSYWNGNATTLKAGNTTRKILVTTSGYSQGSEGVIAYSTMNFKGNNVTIDSFNSADPNHSIWQTAFTYHGMPYGIYSDTLSYNSNNPPSRTADVMVATDGSLISVQNANIYGYVDTAPGGTASVGSQGSVGDLSYVHNNTQGIEAGHARDDMNATFPSKHLPNPSTNGWQTNWLSIPTPPSGTVIRIGGTLTEVAGVWQIIGGSLYTNKGSGFALPSPGGGTATYSMVITNRIQNTNNVYYSISTLNQSLYVDAPYVVLYCTNGIDYSGNGDYLTLNTNADVSIYTTGNVNMTGQATIDNGADYAHAFNLYDVAGYTNLSLSFKGQGIGTAYIYTPNSSLSFSGSGGTYGVVGCVFCNNITINGNYNFHFDESLNQSTPSDQFLPTMWQEVQ